MGHFFQVLKKHVISTSSTPASAWPCALGVLAVFLLLSGLDDFIPVLICALQWLRKARGLEAPNPTGPPSSGERRVAIFVPCWKEYGVIANMVRHNLAVIKYRNFDIFLGVYPNDEATSQVACDLAHSYRNVHVSVCANPGPTSKADCLNSIYSRMQLFEQESACFFDTVVLHDAEDLIHPDALSTINTARADYAMVQVPVLPLPTPLTEFTHAIYCDEFSEFQTIDMRARGFSRSFIPSNGVGTGFAREILDRLLAERGRIFDPVSLTEDYEIGVYIHNSGYKQLFVPLQRRERELQATREYFPRKIKGAIRQRTRWVTGIALQGWQRDGWRGSWPVKYWFWRDRKGLFANPLGLLTNVLFVVGVVDLGRCVQQHRPWIFATSNAAVLWLCFVTLLIQCFRLTLRMICVARIYGLAFGLFVPLRALHGNLINCAASVRAGYSFLRAKVRRQPLVWLKTEHAYPGRNVVLTQKRDLPDVILAAGIVSEEKLSDINSQMPEGADWAEFLLSVQVLSEEQLCQALSLQSGLPVTHVDVEIINPRVTQTLPARVQEKFEIIPYSVEDGRLLIAGTRVPSPEVLEQLKTFCRLSIDFQLVTRRNYNELRSLISRAELVEAQ